ncbi:hypothetical protein [Dietzia sp. PP-33]|jgi:hypothetical protein|uniref:hypothetical protein n=1 Tax=Dietzia sp. PP-33 TaxID=2957500 RepID=UPI0029ACED24|nr:hypothetical protein [Dietzia sp. PP-33]MDX2357431.1 hypothetical protein [Dietzia sp. PP-33]
MAVKMNLTLTLDGVTYGELYEFVDAVRAAGVPADEPVRCLGSDDKGDRFEVEVGPERRRAGAARAATGALVGEPVAPATGPVVSTSPSIASVAETVRSMVRNGDDLDRVIAALGDLRKFLR